MGQKIVPFAMACDGLWRPAMSLAEPRTDNFFMRNATAIAIGAVTLLMLLAGLLFWRQQEASLQARGWLVHTHEVIGHIELLQSKLEDTETGQRGYLLTGSEEYLEPYQDALRDAPATNTAGALQQHRAMELGRGPPKDASPLGPGVANASLQQHRSVPQELAFIRDLTADNPAQQSNLDEMDDVAGKLFDYLSASIQARRNQDGQNRAAEAGAGIDIHRGK